MTRARPVARGAPVFAARRVWGQSRPSCACPAAAALGTALRAGKPRSVTGRTYAENRPYLVPETMEELAGPLTGVLILPERLDRSERAAFRLDVPAERNLMYERVIREATRPGDLREYLNGAVLREVWRNLFLPARVRRMWEDRFPDLALAA